MSKRFTDTNKYKKPFLRGLKGAYKLLWDYLYHDCNHAGIWIVDFEIAQIYIGLDMKIEREKALKMFNKDEIRIVEFDKNKWFIPSFVEFQYGELSEKNRVHKSVIDILIKNKLYDLKKGLLSPLQTPKDKDKDKEKEIDKIKEQELNKESVEETNKYVTGSIEVVDHFFTFLTPRETERFKKQRNVFLDIADKLLRIDKYTINEINQAVVFAKKDHFWSSNFQAFTKLRKKNKDDIYYIEVFLDKYKKSNKSNYNNTNNLSTVENQGYDMTEDPEEDKQRIEFLKQNIIDRQNIINEFADKDGFKNAPEKTIKKYRGFEKQIFELKKELKTLEGK